MEDFGAFVSPNPGGESVGGVVGVSKGFFGIAHFHDGEDGTEGFFGHNDHVVCDVGEGPFHMINPVMEETSGSWTYEEGCLSVPEYYWPIKRAAYARARGIDLDGREVVFEGEELMGRVLQHELDHLAGTLLLRRLGRRTRKEALKQIREQGFVRGPE